MIDVIAEALGVKVSTARSYCFEGHGPDYVDLRPQPTMYEWGGDEYTLAQLADEAGVKKNSVSAALCKNVPLGGHRVRRVESESFTIGRDGVENLIERFREAEESGLYARRPDGR